MLTPYSNRLQGFFIRLKWYCLDSLKGRLIALSLGFSLTLLWILVFLSTSFQQQKFSEVLFDQQFASVRRLAADIAGELQGRVDMLTVSAARIPDKLSTRVLDDHLSQLVTLHQAFTSGIIVIGLDGRVMADYPAMPGRRGMDVGERDYFQNVVKTGKPAIATLVTARSLQRPTLVITVPVRDHAGTVRAVLAGAIDLSAPNFFGLVFERKMAGKGQFYVTSPHNHLVLASTDPARVLTAAPAPGQHAVYDRFVAGFEGSTSARNTEGIATLFSASSIPMTNWLVTATYPAEVAFQPVTAMRHYLIAMAAILTLLAVCVAHWMTRRLLAPLDEANQAMQRMTHDMASLVPLTVKDKGEIGGIIHHFNALVEDRHRSKAALNVSEQRLRSLFEYAPDAIYVCNRSCVAYANAAALQLFGADSPDQVVGHSLLDRVHPDSQAAAQERILLIIEARETVAPVEVKLQRMDGTAVYARISAMPFDYENEPVALAFARDITDRKLAEQALRESEERFRCLVALSSEWYWEHDKDLVVTSVAGWKAIKNGKIPEHGIGENSWKIEGIWKDEPSWRVQRATVEARRPFKDFEYERAEPGPDGSVVWYSISGEPMFDEDGIYKGYRGTGKDITERKLAEEALRQSRARIRDLAAHQSTIKETERKRIARDLHDELGQTLLAIRLDATTLTEQTAAAHPEFHRSARLMLEHIDTAMTSVKTIINDLRPFVLDLGLLAAMEWQVHEFESMSGIPCDLEVDDEDSYRHLDASHSTALFRVLQESLTNITRHAKARQVSIAIRTEEGQLEMTIADDGIGIAQNQRRKKQAFGLVGIEERIKAIGGTFAVDSAPGKGTRLRFSIPLPVSIEAPC
ncbi:PAS domain S-box protein [Noviherbaspirillum sedimenti]|uniref:Oxygen sensor histidine kinase NreB n=1 Tax=Noviherbaspirillum sedimenti TaxID=2320865 RepID=A0A3A3FYU9_9BURK|nr:PAS domain S-box protein [Noviherbaspirillum sedimenti]RJG01317.1 PAS domain S-box protein [Noviherbaspirillum sedimenti]